MTCSATASVLGRFETTWSTTCCLLGRFETTWKQRENWCRLQTARNFFWKYIQQITCNEIECQQQELRDLYAQIEDKVKWIDAKTIVDFDSLGCQQFLQLCFLQILQNQPLMKCFLLQQFCRMDFWIIYSQPGLGADWLYRFQPQPFVWQSIWSKLIFFSTHLASS